MSETREPLGFDQQIIASLLRDLIAEQQRANVYLQEMRDRQPIAYKQLVGRLYIASKERA